MIVEDGKEEVFLDLSSQEDNANAEAEAAQLAAAEAALQSDTNTQELEAAAEAARVAADAAALQNINSQEQVVIEDSKLLEVLSERLGRTIGSLDELTKVEEKQLNPQIQAIDEWSKRTGRPVEDWVKFNKDYSTMSDVDKAREILALKYPTFSQKEIELELGQYIESADDLEEDVDVKTLNLKKLISTEGKLLDEVKLELGKPIEGFNKIPEEIQEEVNFAKSARESYDKVVKEQQDYDKGIVTSVETLTGLEINLDEGLNINYNMTPEDKKDLPTFLAEMPHWRNEDGSWNHDSVVADALKIKNFDKIVKMAYQQGVASGNEKLLKDANNITLDRPNMEGQPDGDNKGIVIEGLDKIIGTGTKAKFGRSKHNK